MSRRPASFTQADVARALRAAQQAGPEWQVVIEGGVIRLVRAVTRPETPVAAFAKIEPAAEEKEPDYGWRL
jgi:hypothetical protein